MSMLDLEAVTQTPCEQSPFPHMIVPRAVRPDALEEVNAAFPRIRKGGSFPLSSLSYGPAFQSLVDELFGDAFRNAVEEKLGLDLSGRPATLTVRGQTRRKDGQIHTDSKTKLVTVLLYLNPVWEAEGGRLRLLRSPDDIEDTVAEVSPEAGAMVIFQCVPNAWHGHKPYAGERRSLQLNWVTDAGAAQATKGRHSLSKLFKTLTPLR